MSSIGVIGSGNIGATLGEAWRRAGHAVVYGSRSPDPPRSVSIADAIAGAEVVLLALPGAAVPQLLVEHGPALDGRVVIDATNDMGGQRLHHADAYRESSPGAPEDAGVERLIADIGARGVRVGDIDAIDVVDGVGRLWLTLVFRQGHPRRLGFRLLAD
jgi:predicted dinucleotide-binding enzyme